ncbi:uncharacterized protein LOC122962588 [Acropora millepora]|uniref:uncharacterized protein LOC122962588 n=1 Tax=Acropora millepora TaxID=45264 RepID=UPI001CF59BFA|nr:uncharacterized protein LOC122962588 [Acropora millepora]
MNPQCLFKKKKLDKEKISRVFSRVAVIPFIKVSGNQRLERCLSLKAELQPVLERTVLSVGTLIELQSSFATMKEDDLFKEICNIMGETRLDMRSQMNYALVLFATGKILEKLQLKEAYYNIVESFFSGKVVPRHIELLAQDGGKADSAVDYNEDEEAEMMSVVNRIVQSCSVDPEKAKHFFIPKTFLTKCKCGEVMGFKVDEALAFIGEKGKEQALKRFISKTGRGCVGRLTLPGRGQLSGCLHIQRHLFSNDSNDEAFLQPMKKKVSGDVLKESEEAAATESLMPVDTILNDKVPTPLETVEDDDEDLLQRVQAFLPAEMESQRSKVPETGKDEGTSSNFEMDQDDLDKLALDEELAKASLVRTALENPRLKNQATKRVQRTDKLQDGLTPREVVSGKRARKTTKK